MEAAVADDTWRSVVIGGGAGAGKTRFAAELADPKEAVVPPQPGGLRPTGCRGVR